MPAQVSLELGVCQPYLILVQKASIYELRMALCSGYYLIIGMVLKYLVAALLLASVLGQSAAWPDIQTGKATPVTSFAGSSAPATYTYSLSHSISAPRQTCLALISYHSLLSTTFSFNTSTILSNSTLLVFSTTTFGTTYFQLLSYHYLISSHPDLEVKDLCYYTSSMLTGSGPRPLTFSNATTSLGSSTLLVLTLFVSFKITNTQGTHITLSANSSAASGVISTTLSTSGQNQVEWVCLAVLLYDPRTTLTGSFYRYKAAPISYAAGLANALPTNSAFLRANTMFFGLSSLNLSLTRTDSQLFVLESGNWSSPYAGAALNENQEELVLEELFMWTDACIGNTSNYVPITGFTCTSNCTSQQYVLNQYCVSCGLQTGNCLTCNQSDCLTCDGSTPIFRQLNTMVSPHVCDCLTGYYEAGGNCSLCSIAITNCVNCTSATACTSCITGYTPSGGGCVCNVGSYLINGSCVPLMGCLDYRQPTSGPYCIKCDTDNYFQMLGNRTCACLANTNYNNATGMCEGACGDGVSLGNKCDLNASRNGANASGCRANCTVEDKYYCSNPSTSSPSICVNTTSYSGSFLYAQKDLASNTAYLYIQLSPNDHYLASMDFASLVKTSIPTSALTASFDSATGVLLIKATFTASIQGTTQLLNISFDHTVVYAPPLEIYQELKGTNARLEFGTFESYNSIIYYLAMLVGAAALLFALLAGLLGFKMVGFQLCLPAQVTYLSLCLLQMPFSSLSALSGLSTSTGYNSISSFELASHLSLDKGLIVLQRTNFFLENCNFTYAVVPILMLLSALSRCAVRQREQEPLPKKGDSKKKGHPPTQPAAPAPLPPSETTWLERVHFFLVDRLLVNFWVLALALAIFSFGLQVQARERPSLLSVNAHVAGSLLVLLVELGGLMFVVLKVRSRCRSVSFGCRSRYYPLFYIFCQLASVLVIVCSHFATSYALLLLPLPQALLLFFYLRLQPHGPFRTFLTLSGLYCQLLPLVGVALFLVCQYAGSAMLATVSGFVLLGLYLVAFGLSIARLVLKYREAQQKSLNMEQKVRLEEENLEAMTYSSIKNQLIHSHTDRKLNWEHPHDHAHDHPLGHPLGHPHEAAPPLPVVHGKGQPREAYQKVDQLSEEERVEEQEQDELKRLKMRLKKEIYEKRNFEL